MSKQKHEMGEKRRKLIELSLIARAAIDAGTTDARTVNEWIMEQYPAGEYHTYKGWKEKGKQVQKNERGYIIWSRKLKMKKHDDATGEDKEFKAWMVCNLFHESQVA